MNDVSKHNGSASAAAPPSGPNSYDNLSEAEFLTHEAELAKTALSNTLAELIGSFAQAGNLKLWAHHYPWVTAGLAVATGFALAAVATGGSTTGNAEESIPASEEVERQREVDRHESVHARRRRRCVGDEEGAGRRQERPDRSVLSRSW